MNNNPGVYFSLYCLVFQNKSVTGTHVCFGNWEFQLAMLHRGSSSKLHFYFNVSKPYATNKSHQSVSSHRAASSGDRLSHSNDRAARLRVVCPSFLFVFKFDRSHFQKSSRSRSVNVSRVSGPDNIFTFLSSESLQLFLGLRLFISGPAATLCFIYNIKQMKSTLLKSYIRTTTFFFLQLY